MCLFFFEDQKVYFTLQYRDRGDEWVYRNLASNDPGLLPAACALIDSDRLSVPALAPLGAYVVTGDVVKGGKATDAYAGKTVTEILGWHDEDCPARVDPGDDWLATLPRKRK